MKNIFISIIALLGCIVASAQSLNIQSVALAPGGTADLSIELNNSDQPITSLQFDLSLPHGITVNGDAALTSRATSSHSIYANTVDSKYRVVVHSAGSEAFTGTSGAVVNIPIAVANTIASDSYTATLSNISLVMPNGTEIEQSNTNVTIDIANGDTSSVTLSITSVALAAGSTGDLSIELDNSDQPITSLQFDLSLPDGITVNGDAALTSRATSSHSIYANTVDSKYRVVVHSAGSEAFTGTSSAVVTIPIATASTIAPDSYTATLSDISIVAPNGTEINPIDVTGTIDVSSSGVISVSLDKTSITLMICESQTLIATVTSENASDIDVNWASSDESVATVDSNGKVIGVGQGETVITASCGGLSATCAVTVSNTIFGDVDNNGEVTIIDAVKIVDYLMGNEPAVFNLEAADVDRDNEITIQDVLRLAKIVLG